MFALKQDDKHEASRVCVCVSVCMHAPACIVCTCACAHTRYLPHIGEHVNVVETRWCQDCLALPLKATNQYTLTHTHALHNTHTNIHLTTDINCGLLPFSISVSKDA